MHLKLILVSAALITTAGGVCPCFHDCGDGRFYEKMEGGCFRYNHAGEGWEEAQRACGLDGGMLAENERFLEQYSALIDTWVGARYTAGMRWNSSGALVSSAFNPTGGKDLDCGFLLQGTVYPWSDCTDPLAFLCEKRQIQFTPMAHTFTAAGGQGPSFGSSNPNITISTTTTPTPRLLYKLSQDSTCPPQQASSLTEADGTDMLRLPKLSVGVTYTLCWYGPVIVEGLGTVEMEAAPITVTTQPLPTLDDATHAIPVGVLPASVTFEGSNLMKDAMVALFTGTNCDGTLIATSDTPQLTIPDGTSAGTYYCCVAAWGGLDDTGFVPTYTPTSAVVTVIPEPVFTAANMYVPLAVGLSGGVLTLTGSNVAQKYIWVSLRPVPTCGGSYPTVVLSNEGTFGIPTDGSVLTGMPLYVCYTTSQSNTAHSDVFQSTGVTVTITPEPVITLSDDEVMASYAEGLVGPAVTINGRNLVTRESSSMLYALTGIDRKCTANVSVGSELTSTSLSASGRVALGLTGEYYVCVGSMPSQSSEPLQVFETGLRVSIYPPPSFEEATLWTSSQPAGLPAGNYTDRPSGMHYALATAQDCSSPEYISTNGALPSVPEPDTLTQLTLCWTVSSTPAVWNTTLVTYMYLPVPTVLPQPSVVTVPDEVYFGTKLQVSGKYFRSVTVRYVEESSSCLVSNSFKNVQEECRPYCDQFDSLIPAGLAAASSYRVCVGSEDTGIVVRVTPFPTIEAEFHTVGLGEYHKGFTVPVTGENILFAFVKFVTDDCQRDGEVAVLSTVVRFNETDQRLAPGTRYIMCIATGRADVPESIWVSSGVLLEVKGIPVFNSTVFAPQPDEIWGSSNAVTASLTGTHINQLLWFAYCKSSSDPCANCTDVQQSSSGSVVLPTDVVSTTVAEVLHICWAPVDDAALAATSATLASPVANPFPPQDISLTYGESLKGVQMTPAINVAGLHAAFSSTKGTTLWKPLNSGKYSGELPASQAGVYHTLLLSYSSSPSTSSAVILTTGVGVTWMGPPTFTPQALQVSLAQLVSGTAAMDFEGSFISRGVYVRIGCGGSPSPLGLPAVPIEDDSAALPMPVLGVFAGGVFDICWAPYDPVLSAPDWTAGGETGVTVALQAVPVFGNAKITISRHELLSATPVTPSLSGSGLTTPLAVHVCSKASVSYAFTAVNATYGTFTVSNAQDLFDEPVTNAPLCWSLVGADTVYDIAGGSMSTMGVPGFRAVSDTVTVRNVVAGYPLLVLQGVVDDDLFFEIRSGSCTGVKVLNGTHQDLLLTEDVDLHDATTLAACWSVVDTDGTVLTGPFAVSNWEVTLEGFPIVTAINDASLPLSDPFTITNNVVINIKGTNLDNAFFAVATSCNTVVQPTSFPIDLRGLSGVYSLCISISGSVGTFNQLVVLDILVPTTAAPTDAPATPFPDTEAPATSAPPTLTPTDTPPGVTKAPDTDAPDTDAPKTPSPDTRAPDTDAPDTQAPDTLAPDTDAPYTDAPDTMEPMSNAPNATNPPDTDAPDTDAPDTDAPDTDAPDTDAPDTNPPYTDAPDTDVPETDAPDTDAPDTNVTAPGDTMSPMTDAPATDTPSPDTETPCKSLAALGEVSAYECFGSLNEAGRLVGCLRTGGVNTGCLATYDRCVENLVGECPPKGVAYKEKSQPLSVLLGLDNDDFQLAVHGGLFTAAVAAEMRIVPWLVNVTRVEQGSVLVTFEVSGPGADVAKDELQKKLDAGVNPFTAYSWQILSSNNTNSTAPADHSSGEEVPVILLILCAVAFMICLILLVCITMTKTYMPLPPIPPELAMEEGRTTIADLVSSPSPTASQPQASKPLPHPPASP